MTFEFEVGGLPPHKDLSYSLWGTQWEKVSKLRHAMLKEMNRKYGSCLTQNIRIRLTLYLSDKEKNRADLDNYLGGICDALQKADRKACEEGRLNVADELINDKTIDPFSIEFISDDKDVIDIQARIIPVATPSKYTLTISETQVQKVEVISTKDNL